MADVRLIVAKDVDVDLRNEYLSKADGIVTAAGMSIFNAAIDRARCVVMRSPTIDAAPVVHAWWVDPCVNKYGHPCHHCSACRFKASQKDRNFCPNCGAKMDGGTDT